MANLPLSWQQGSTSLPQFPSTAPITGVPTTPTVFLTPRLSLLLFIIMPECCFHTGEEWGVFLVPMSLSKVGKMRPKIRLSISRKIKKIFFLFLTLHSCYPLPRPQAPGELLALGLVVNPQNSARSITMGSHGSIAGTKHSPRCTCSLSVRFLTQRVLGEHSGASVGPGGRTATTRHLPDSAVATPRGDFVPTQSSPFRCTF